MAAEELVAIWWWIAIYGAMLIWLGIIIGWAMALQVKCYRAPVVMIHMEPED